MTSDLAGAAGAATPGVPRADPHLGPGFRAFWAGETVSVFCREIGVLALPVVAVVLLHASSFEVGVLNAATTAAFLLVGLPAGAWVDRWLKRRVMIAADLVRVAASLVIPVLWLSDHLAMWHLYAVAAVIGVATVFFDVAYQSYVPFLVPSAQVPRANSRLEGTAQIAHIAGPAVGGLLLKVVSAPLLILADGVGYAASALLLTRVHDREVPTSPEDHEPLRRAIPEGLRFVLGHDLLRRIVGSTAIGNLGNTMIFTLMPVLFLRELALEPWVMGAVFGVGAAGGVVGALLAARLGRLVGEGTLIPLSTVAIALGVVIWPVAPMLPLWLALVLMVASEFLLSFAILAYNITQVSMRQRVCPPRLLGRMNASARFVVWGVMPIASLLAGVLAEGIGLVPTLWVGVVLSVVAIAPVWFSPLLGMRRLPSGSTDDA
ncbi:MFS transporter [Nocardioides jejuensis]|uniref:MFS transporter n=1 Tax=Nocardioides jejuensis TaxID=2502782 RepID=A0A4R1BY12_9ACTN|nr:MFS transporter [Nocardioides jejuensis]TCJ22881.1 MFS transporter [Nocardioides jejuensis]